MRSAGGNLSLRLHPGPTQAFFKILHSRVDQNNLIRPLKLPEKNRVQLVERSKGESSRAFELMGEMLDYVGPDPVIPSVGISVADNPSQSGFRPVCRHESVPLQFRHEPLLLVKDLNQQGHLAQSMG
jgi:hypothetical protein